MICISDAQFNVQRNDHPVDNEAKQTMIYDRHLPARRVTLVSRRQPLAGSDLPSPAAPAGPMHLRRNISPAEDIIRSVRHEMQHETSLGGRPFNLSYIARAAQDVDGS